MKRRGRRPCRAGAVLLEVLLALVVLSVVASSVSWMTVEALHAVSRAHEEEARLASAAALLRAVSIWPRADLDRHLGATEQGPWILGVDRVDPALYAVVVRDASDGRAVFRTAFYRPVEAGS